MTAKRIYLVNRDFQLRYTRIAVAVGLCSTAMTVFLILYPLFYLGIVRFPNFIPEPFLLGIGLAAVLNFIIIALMGIIVTNRIAGPMFSLVRQMRAMQTGRWMTHLRVRASDDLKYVVRNYNDLVDYLVTVTRKDLARLDAVLAQLRASGDNKTATADLQALRDEVEARLAAEDGKTA